MKPTTLIVYNTDHLVGAETARLAVAASIDVIGIGESALDDERWTRGVVWRPKSLDSLEKADAIVVVGRPDNLALLLQAIQSSDIPRIVFVELGTTASTTGRDETSIDATLVPGPIASERFDPETLPATDGTLAIETVAMAALRCAVEDDRQGRFTPEEVAHIGDAMMLQ